MQNIRKQCPLFLGIEEDAYFSLLEELHAYPHTYQQDSWIIHEEDHMDHIGILLYGKLQLSQNDLEGNRMLLHELTPGDIFGEVFALQNTSINISIQAIAASQILWISIRHILSPAPSESCCLLLQNLLRILAEKNLHLRNTIHVLSGRSLREKLLRYLTQLSTKQNSLVVHLPYDRQGLADALCVDRSALSRELSKMKQEGILDVHKSTIILKGAVTNRQNV